MRTSTRVQARSNCIQVRAGEQRPPAPAPQRPPGRRAPSGSNSAAGLAARHRELGGQGAAQAAAADEGRGRRTRPPVAPGGAGSKSADADEEEEREGDEEEEEDGLAEDGGEDGWTLQEADIERLLDIGPPSPPPPLPPATEAAVLAVLSTFPLPPALPPLLLDAVSRGRLPPTPHVLHYLLTQLQSFTPLATFLPRSLEIAAALDLDPSDGVGIVLSVPHLLLPTPVELAARAGALRATLELLEGEGVGGWVVQNPTLLAVPAEVLDAKLGDVKAATNLSRKQSARLVTKWMFPELR